MKKFKPDPLQKGAPFIRRLEYWLQYVLSFLLFDFEGFPMLSGLLTGLALILPTLVLSALDTAPLSAFIRQPTQDTLAGRIQPSQFDTELPSSARAEMLKPKRPAILGRRVYEPPKSSGILKWAGSIAVVVILLGGAITNHLNQPQKQSVPIAQPTPVPIVQPIPRPAQPQPAARPAPPAVSARRARLVLFKRWAGNGVWEVMDSTGRTIKILVDPAPRAQLVQFPEWQLGTALAMRMPYDESFEVRGVFRGYLNDATLLPQSGVAIGDTWVVGRTPWVWVTVPGTTAPTWVDP